MIMPKQWLTSISYNSSSFHLFFFFYNPSECDVVVSKLGEEDVMICL
jgi:hypothetical protein